MDLEGRIFDESEYAFSEDEDCNVDSVLEQERCGICIDIVIDRGALDCCDHWFCFACIDNWAAITNLCPICKMEFQIITCLPVYDTIRGIRSEDHPISRNDDWCIEAKSSALSFPSDYISEDAVKCLEGDGCKIRNSLQMTEEDLTFDTSIACDSCDTWYHAFCVGFNPELTCESTWFCPRCINNEVQQNSVMFSSQNHGKYAIIQSADTGWTGDPSLLGKVSVSVADAGETAVVVSLIDGKDKMDSRKSLLNEIETELEKMIPTSLENLNFNDSVMDLHPKDDSCNRLSCNNLGFSDYKGHYTITDVDNSDTFFDISPEIIDFQSDGDVKEATLPSLFLQDDGLRKSTNDITESKLSSSTSQQVSFPFCNVTTSGDEKQINKLETTSNSVYSEDSEALSPVAFVQSEVKIEPGSKPNNTSHGLVAVSHESTTTSCCKDRMVEMCQKDEDDCNLLEKQKMKQLHSPNVQKRDCIRKRETESLYPTKKLKSDGRSKIFPPESQSASNSQDWAGKNRGGSMLYVKTEELETADIMSIVRETDCSSQDLQIGMKFSNKAMDSKDGTCGLRVKKVMRRIGEKKESSILAQELGKEIREVVQQKGLNDGGKMNDFDENLLAAFRAATVKSKAQLSGHPNLVFAGANKHILVKGRKRENLTKKIYGTASGKRRHAWVRDLEIEFWKHRCRSAQSEKVETLQSVLELLKKATDPSWYGSKELVSQEENTDSILSRVYLADASVFPRKDDIKPLSMLSENSQLDNNNLDKVNNLREVSRVSLNDDNHLKANKNLITKSTLQVYSSDIVDKKLHAPSFQSAKANQKPNSGGAAAESIQTSGSSYSKVSLTFSKGHALSDARTDKIKWAQEVLSRKISSTNVNTSKGVEHDNNTLLKGKYPLLAQLPLDMRPVPVSARHSKVPVSVRQNQLYRIAEHYLRRTNLQVIRRTAETELAIADAINVEKGIFERSNSKLVYVNLCSLAVSQHTNQSVLADSGFSDCSMINFNVDGVVAEATTSDSETGQRPESAVTTLSNSTVDTSKMSNAIEDDLLTDHKTSEWNSVEEALKMAGLFSETPPNSPYRVCEESNLQEAARGDIKEEEGPATDSVVEAFPSRDSKSESSIQQIPENTAECDCINVVVEPPFSSSNPLEIQKESESEKSLMVVSMDNPAPTTKYEGERNDDPYLEERQVMQGPNKQHLVNQISAKDVNEMQKPLQIREEKYEISAVKESHTVNDQSEPSVHDSSCDISNATLHDETAAVGDTSQSHSMGNVQLNSDNTATEEMKKPTNDKSELTTSISKKVEAYIKEHIRPLCKSGIITVEQYRWAVGKAVDKVMKFHYNAKNANFLIREGEKVKKLAEQYLEAAQRKELR